MSIISKLKGSKKAANKQKEETKKTEDQKPASAPYKHVPTHAATDALTASAAGKPEDQEKISEHSRARMSRTDSDMSGTFQMPKPKRSPSSLSNEWAPSQGIRETNFSMPTPPAFVMPPSSAGLMGGLPPVPPIPSRYSSTSLSAQSSGAGPSRTSQSRTSSYQGLNSALAPNRNSSFQGAPAGHHAKMSAYRSHMGQSGKSPLSSHDHSPVDSETGSTRSSASSGIGLEMHHATAPAPPRASAFTPPPEKKYFAHKKNPNAPAAEATPKPAAPPVEVKKNNRFSVFKKGSTVAAH